MKNFTFFVTVKSVMGRSILYYYLELFATI